MVPILKNPPACLLFHANDPARLGGFAMLPAILRKSPVLAQQSPAPGSRSIDARSRRTGRRRHDHLLAASDAASACPDDLASGVARHDIAPAFRAGISGG